MLGPFVVLFGPTGTGKTESLYRHCRGMAEVISADSMQVYRELTVGTAKPSLELRSELPHHLVDICSLHETFDLGTFVEQCERLIAAIAARGKLPVVAGGTAFYLRGLLYGLPEAPRAEPELRRTLFEELRERGEDALRRELELIDPLSAGRIERGDTYRIVRALEVHRASGRPLSSFRRPSRPRRDLEVTVIGLYREREELYERINRRVEAMLENGLAEEVAALLGAGYRGDEPGLRGIGYREFFDALAVGELRPADLTVRDTRPDSVLRVIEQIKRNTRRYAKRQLTFFRRFDSVRWVDAEDHETLERLFRY